MHQSSINLNDSLRLIFPHEKITWLTDKDKTELRVQWVCLDAKNTQPGDLLILESKNLSAHRLKTASKQGIEAVLLIGQLPELETISYPVPTILVNSKKDLRQIQQQFVALLSNKQYVLNERKLQIHTQLTRLAAEGVELEDIARAILEITRHGVLIQDKRLNIIAEVPSGDLQPFWENITDQLSEIKNLPVPLQDRHRAGEQNLGINQTLPGEISRVIVPITVSNIARGYLSVIGIEGTLDTLDQLVAEQGALICAIDMSRTKAVRETEKKLQSDLLTALLQENLSPRDAKLWIDALGLDRSQAHAALQFAWDSSNPPSRRRLETMINGEVARMGIKVIMNPTGDAIICFCQVPPIDTGYLLAFELGANVIEQTKKEFPNAHIRCGIGSPTPDLNQWHLSFREAGLALDMATRLGADKPLYYPDLSVHRLLMLLENHPEIEVFQNDILGSLLSKEGKTQFIETLEAYFENQGNLTQTANALYIHRNTLFYRMERIKELSGLDLTNSDTALAVQLALKIYRMMESKN